MAAAALLWAGMAVPAWAASAPGAPPTKVKPGNGSVIATWTAPASNGSAITGYVVGSRKYLTASKTWGAWTSVSVAASARSKSLAYVNGTTVQVRVRARNAIGSGPWSAVVQTKAGLPSAVPGTKATAGNGAATVTWSAASGNGNAVSAYRVFWRQNVNGTWSAWSAAISVASTARSRTISGLVNGRSHQFRVAAVNRIGQGPFGAAVGATPKAPGGLRLISTASDGTARTGLVQSGVWSPDGTRVALVTSARLSVTDTNNALDIYVKNLVTGAVTLVTRSAANGPSDGDSGDPTWSPDGTMLAFTSEASNLTPLSSSSQQIYVSKVLGAAVEQVSLTWDAKRPQVFSTSPAWSPDGQWIAFVTRDPSMVEGGVGGAPGASNVYARLITDLGSSAKLVSNKATDLATAGNGDSDAPMFAPGSDNTILYTTMATDIVGGSVGVMKLVAEPLGGGALVRVDRTTAGTGGANGVISQAVWSPDGTKVAFISTADNLAPNDTNGAGDVFVSVPGTSLQRISQASASVGANGLSRSVQWSGDSTKLAFETSASNLTSDTTSLRKVVRADAAGGGLVLVSTLTGGTVPADADAFSPSINADGTLISFRTRATNLTFSLIDQVYVKNLTTQATIRISQSAGGEFGNAFSGGGDVNNFSPTSNQYLLRSDATNLTAEGVSGAFVWTP